MLDDIRRLGDPALRMKTKPVDDFGKSLRSLTNRMQHVLRRDDRGIGLAANQIGVSCRLFVVDSEYINLPFDAIANAMVADGSALCVYEEGCMSIPGFYFPVTRAESVLIKGQAIDGRDVEYELDGLAARLAQHEIDHLDGLTLFDRIPAESRGEAWELLREVDAAREARDDRHAALFGSRARRRT
jgi:peptide deformylase